MCCVQVLCYDRAATVEPFGQREAVPVFVLEIDWQTREEARNSSGSYVTSFPFEAAKHGVGLYGLQFQSALESAPKEMRTTTGVYSRFRKLVAVGNHPKIRSWSSHC